MAAARPRIAIEKSVLHGICIRSQIQIVIHIEQMVVVGTIVKLIVGLGVLCVNADLAAADDDNVLTQLLGMSEGLLGEEQLFGICAGRTDPSKAEFSNQDRRSRNQRSL